jgi:hypothetical protein
MKVATDRNIFVPKVDIFIHVLRIVETSGITNYKPSHVIPYNYFYYFISKSIYIYIYIYHFRP